MSDFMVFINSIYEFLVKLFSVLGIKLPEIFNPEIEPLD